jgi:hypothetical protein
MVRPAAFGFNSETAVNNYFQHEPTEGQGVHAKAVAEFDSMVEKLRAEGVSVKVVDDTLTPPKPDAIFPNNWLSTSPGGIVSVFPMYASNRRTEKRDEILQELAREFHVNAVQDWSEYEVEGRFLEGTGSMVIDHDHKMIYAAVSERTHLAILEKYAATNGYQAMAFLATDKNGRPIYHTNVMMAIGSGYCVLCDEAIVEEWEKIAVKQLLESSGKTIVSITLDQMHAFAGNMLEVQNQRGEKLLLMSQSAFDVLSREQKELLGSFAKLLSFAVPTIEEVEGGSVRCMIAEIFLDRKE